MPIEKDKVGLVFLGAQSFPRSKNFQPSPAFHNSYKKIKSFFTDPGCIEVPPESMLDLFDSDKGQDDQDALIAGYIESQKEVRKITDLIIYYIGHGGYAPQNGGYLLAIKSTRDENLGSSSITMKSLAVTISKKAKNLRTFIILDCCFSGDARNVFQSPQTEILKKALDKDFPSEGIALLCSSSSDDPSLIVSERQITMFTEGFEKALRYGNFNINNRYLSLRQLQQLTFQFIKDFNPGEFVHPEVHTPSQPGGDIADLPYFPNLGFRINGYDIVVRKRLLEAKIIANDLAGLTPMFMDFINDFDIRKKYEIDMVLIASECNELEGDFSKLKNDNESADNKRERLRNSRRELYKKILAIVSDLLNNQRL